MRFLIIGASGFIGSRLWATAAQQGHVVSGTTCRSTSTFLAKFDQSRNSILDCFDKSFFQTDELCYVVHCAGYGGPDDCFRNPDESRRANVAGVQQLVRDLSPFRVRHVYLSTSYVFDGQRGSYRETDPCSPICEYGRQKLAVEDFLRSTLHDVLVLRVDKVVSDEPQGDHLFVQWHTKWRHGRPVLCVRGQTMSPVSVTDVAQAVMESCARNLLGLYQVAGLRSWTRKELAECLRRALQLAGEIRECDTSELGMVDQRPLRCDLVGALFQAQIAFQPVICEELCASFAAKIHAAKIHSQPTSM